MCHLINKDLLVSGFNPQENIEIRLFLPPNLQVSEGMVQLLIPDTLSTEIIEIPLIDQVDYLEITVPTLDVYGLLMIPVTA